MEQGCPHRSILPHIFPDCNSFAIKIGGKFCGVRGVCPGWGLAPALPARRASAVPGGGRARFVACLPCHCGARGGACLLCRLPTLPLWCPRGACLLCRLLTLPLTCFLAPIPPRPPSRREGGDYRLFFARGFAPCIPRAEPGRHWLSPPRGRGPSQTPPSLATDSSISPGPPSPWLPALPVGMHFRCFCTEPQAPFRRVPVWRKL